MSGELQPSEEQDWLSHPFLFGDQTPSDVYEMPDRKQVSSAELAFIPPTPKDKKRRELSVLAPRQTSPSDTRLDFSSPRPETVESSDDLLRPKHRHEELFVIAQLDDTEN